MATISKPNTFVAGTNIVASQVNSNFDTIYNDYNGNITNANIAAGAAIADTKLATITTAGKVNATAFTEGSETAGVILGHDGTDWTSISVSTQRYKVLMSMGSGCAASFQKINLTSAQSITGTLPAANLNTDVRIKGWVLFEGDSAGPSLTILDSYNVTKVLDYATGKYGIYWTTAFANSSYAVVATCAVNGQNGYARHAGAWSVNAGSATIGVVDHNNAAADAYIVNVMAFGDQ